MPNAIAPGTSDSPILTATGLALAISMGEHSNPRLALDLPVWLLAVLEA